MQDVEGPSRIYDSAVETSLTVCGAAAKPAIEQSLTSVISDGQTIKGSALQLLSQAACGHPNNGNPADRCSAAAPVAVGDCVRHHLLLLVAGAKAVLRAIASHSPVAQLGCLYAAYLPGRLKTVHAWHINILHDKGRCELCL